MLSLYKLNTVEQNNIQDIIQDCKNRFIDQTETYNYDWRVLRLRSVIDIMYQKAIKLENCFEKKDYNEMNSILKTLFNYSIIYFLQKRLPDPSFEEDTLINENDKEKSEKIYDQEASKIEKRAVNNSPREIESLLINKMKTVQQKEIENIEEEDVYEVAVLTLQNLVKTNADLPHSL